MKLRNKKTGEIIEIGTPSPTSSPVPQANQGTQENIPQQGGWEDILPWLGAATAGGIGGMASGGLLTGPGAFAGYMGGRALSGGIKNLTRKPDVTNEQILPEFTKAATVGLSAGAADMLLRGLGSITNKGAVGKRLESFFPANKPADQKLLGEKFGTSESPNPELYKGLSGAAGEEALKNKVGGEIMNQGRAGANIQGPSLADIFNWRKGSYAEKYDKTVPKSMQDVSGRMGKAYSDILHTMEPNSKKWDAIYGVLSKVDNLKRYASTPLKYYLAYKIFNKLGL